MKCSMILKKISNPHKIKKRRARLLKVKQLEGHLAFRTISCVGWAFRAISIWKLEFVLAKILLSCLLAFSKPSPYGTATLSKFAGRSFPIHLRRLHTEILYFCSRSLLKTQSKRMEKINKLTRLVLWRTLTCWRMRIESEKWCMSLKYCR